MFPNVIKFFRDEYYFLSNFYMVDFVDYTGNIWPSVENFFQAMKSLSVNDRERIRNASTAKEAKRMGREILLRDDWESVKVNVMRDALSYKFRQNKDLKDRLISTGNAVLIEGNYYHDNIWGDCYCEKCKNIRGQNYLGRLLMGIRSRL